MPALPESHPCRRKLPRDTSTPTIQSLTLLPYFPGGVFGGQLSAPLWAAGLLMLPDRLRELGLCFTVSPVPLMALKAHPAFEIERSDKKGQ